MYAKIDILNDYSMEEKNKTWLWPSVFLLIAVLISTWFFTVKKDHERYVAQENEAEQRVQNNVDIQDNIALSDFSIDESKKCIDLPSNTADLPIKYKEEVIAKIKNQDCFFEKVDFFAIIDRTVLFTIEPSGLGGYYIYPRHFNLYSLNVDTKEVKGLASKTLGVTGVNSEQKKIAYISFDGNKTYTLTVDTIGTTEKKVFSAKLPSEINPTNAQVGHLSLSPQATHLAVEVGYGPDKERGEIYLIDIANQAIELAASENYHLKITGWKDETHPTWEKLNP